MEEAIVLRDEEGEPIAQTELKKTVGGDADQVVKSIEHSKLN